MVLTCTHTRIPTMPPLCSCKFLSTHRAIVLFINSFGDYFRSFGWIDKDEMCNIHLDILIVIAWFLDTTMTVIPWYSLKCLYKFVNHTIIWYIWYTIQLITVKSRRKLQKKWKIWFLYFVLWLNIMTKYNIHILPQADHNHQSHNSACAQPLIGPGESGFLFFILFDAIVKNMINKSTCLTNFNFIFVSYMWSN